MSLEPSKRADDDREFSFDLADVAETRWDSVLGFHLYRHIKVSA